MSSKTDRSQNVVRSSQKSKEGSVDDVDQNSSLSRPPPPSPPRIVHDPTFESIESSNFNESGDVEVMNSSTYPLTERASSTYEEVFVETKETSSSAVEFWLHIAYLSSFAVFGAVLRVYFGRFFGLDCGAPNIPDFLTPLSSRICVTNNGQTDQTGGALFTDLPANMFGS